MQELKIEAYSLFEFCQKVQEAILEGWSFDFNSNKCVPTMFGSLFETIMVKNVQDSVQSAEKRKYKKHSDTESE